MSVADGMSRWLGVGLLLPVATLLWLQWWGVADGDCTGNNPVAVADIGGHKLTVELAATMASRTCGLSRRDDLAPDRGMLFLFPEAGVVSFWMRQTHFPLSLAFLDADGRILVMTRMPADPGGSVSLPYYHAPQAVTRALEVNAGWFASHGIGIGDRLEITLPTNLTVR